MTECPCGSGQDFEACCNPLLNGGAAPTAEALMRSRYTAFIQGNFAYLDETLVPEKREEVDHAEVASAAKDAIPLGLLIKAKEGGEEQDEAGMVEFVARFQVRGKVQVHHERAIFRRENGRWIYEDGEVNPKSPPVRVQKVGRNEPCPCGSGKKFKKCCGA